MKKNVADSTVSQIDLRWCHQFNPTSSVTNSTLG